MALIFLKKTPEYRGFDTHFHVPVPYATIEKVVVKSHLGLSTIPYRVTKHYSLSGKKITQANRNLN